MQMIRSKYGTKKDNKFAKLKKPLHHIITKNNLYFTTSLFPGKLIYI